MIKDITGMKYGMLTAIKRVEDRFTKSGRRITRWEFECDCGNRIIVDKNNVVKKNTSQVSCGCYHKKKLKEQEGKTRYFNQYDLTGEFGIGFTRKGEEFYFDIEDYEKIKDYCWNIHKGYVSSNIGEKNKLMHRLVTGCPKGLVVDHINRNRNDNRKCNLRVCTQKENVRNSVKNFENSPIHGVTFNKRANRFVVEVTDKYIGTYESKDEAIKERLKAEIIYFKDYSPQLNLVKEYGLIEEFRYIIKENLSKNIIKLFQLD